MNWKDFQDIPIDKLALKLSARDSEETAFVLRQVEGWQKLRLKVPSWAAVDDLLFPPRLSLEQCSGEETAHYKAEVVREIFCEAEEGREGNRTMADLTGGLGIDFSMLSPLFRHSTYVERDEELCRIARHNFPLLGLKDAEIVCDDGVEYLKRMQHADFIFLDPARRDAAGRKTVRLCDCQPDASALLPLLMEKAHVVMLKLSPMLDINEAVRSLGGYVRQVHVVSRGGECKELLIVLMEAEKEKVCKQWETIVREGDISFRFTAEEEKAANPEYADTCGLYLYEPGPATLKAGAFHTVATRYKLRKLHPNSHLYTSDRLIEKFPGRTFKVVRCLTFNKAELRSLHETTGGHANLTIRNFPSSVAILRRKLKLAEGGSGYLFATTMGDGKHALLLCEKTRH